MTSENSYTAGASRSISIGGENLPVSGYRALNERN